MANESEGSQYLCKSPIFGTGTNYVDKEEDQQRDQEEHLNRMSFYPLDHGGSPDILI